MHITGTIADEKLVQVARMRGHADALVVDFDFFVGFEIVPDKHFLFAANQCGAHFDGREPIDIDVSDDVLGEIDGDKGNVFDAVEMLFAGSDDCFGLLVDQVVHDGKVVRGQVPDNVDVVLEKAKVYTQRIVVIQIAQFLSIHEFPDFLDGAGEEEGVVHHDLEVFLLGDFDQFLSLRDRASEGLLDEDMLTVFEGTFGQFVVGPDGSNDGDHIDIRCLQDFAFVRAKGNGGESFVQTFGTFVISVADLDNVSSFVGMEIPDNVGSPISVADHTNAKHRSLHFPRRLHHSAECGVRQASLRFRRARFGFSDLPLSGGDTDKGVHQQPVGGNNQTDPERRALPLMRTIAHENSTRSLREDLKVQPNGPASRILEIQTNHIVKARATAPFHLPQASDAGLDFEDPTAMPNVIGAIFVGEWRTRSYEGHFTHQDVPKLRKLIETGFAEELSDLRDARVGLDLENSFMVTGVPGNVAGDELIDVGFVNLGIAVRAHGAELEELEGFSALSQALLAEENGTLGVEFDGDSDRGENGGQEEESGGTAGDIHHALDAEGKPAVRLAFADFRI